HPSVGGHQEAAGRQIRVRADGADRHQELDADAHLPPAAEERQVSPALFSLCERAVPELTRLMSDYSAPVFLTELLKAKSPSGAEAQAQAVYDKYVKPHADGYANDALGNRLASLNP